MRPYYSDATCDLFCGQAEEILPNLGKFDLLVTDPPYGIGEGNRKRILSRGKRREGDKQKTAATDYGQSDWDAKPPEPWVLDMCRSRATTSIIWGGNYFTLPPARSWLVWDKQNGASDFADCELAWTNAKTAVRIFRFLWAGMLRAGEARGVTRIHPTQKPVELMRWCIGFAPGARTLVDPFAGSCSSLVAAKLLGLRSVGIEADEKSCKAALKRLRDPVLPLFQTAAPAAEVRQVEFA